MYESSMQDKIQVLESASKVGLPNSYVAKELLALMGDSEDAEEIIEQMKENDEMERTRAESMMRRNELKAMPTERPEKKEDKGFVTSLFAKAGL
jgi:hypothetical protein